jgi:hypothetical protein
MRWLIVLPVSVSGQSAMLTLKIGINPANTSKTGLKNLRERKEVKRMAKGKDWICDQCGQEVYTSDDRPPTPIRWDDGHVCHFVEAPPDYGPDDIGLVPPGIGVPADKELSKEETTALMQTRIQEMARRTWDRIGGDALNALEEADEVPLMKRADVIQLCMDYLYQDHDKEAYEIWRALPNYEAKEKALEPAFPHESYGW